MLLDKSQIDHCLHEMRLPASIKIEILQSVSSNNNYGKTASLNKPWTLRHAIQLQKHNRNKIIALPFCQLFANLNQFEKTSFELFHEQWHLNDYLFDKDITLHSINQRISGKYQGINKLGQRLMQMSDKIFCKFNAGEISLNTQRQNLT